MQLDKKNVSNAVEVYGIDISPKPTALGDIEKWHNELKTSSFSLYKFVLDDATKYNLVKDETFSEKKPARFSKMMSLLKDVKKAKENEKIWKKKD